jgi:hypothetical protein
MMFYVKLFLFSLLFHILSNYISSDLIANNNGKLTNKGNSKTISPIVSNEFIFKGEKNELIDITKCLTKKRIVLLGDSTMTETLNSIVILLSKAKPEEVQKYFHYMSLFQCCDSGEFNFNNYNVLFHFIHRNMTVYSEKLSLTIRLRFIGHHILIHNSFGVATLLYPDI